MYNYILECLGGLGGYKFNGPPNKLTYISPTTWIFWVGNTLLEPEVNDSLKILWGFICVLGQQLDDLFYPSFFEPALMEGKIQNQKQKLF